MHIDLGVAVIAAALIYVSGHTLTILFLGPWADRRRHKHQMELLKVENEALQQAADTSRTIKGDLAVNKRR